MPQGWGAVQAHLGRAALMAHAVDFSEKPPRLFEEVLKVGSEKPLVRVCDVRVQSCVVSTAVSQALM